MSGHAIRVMDIGKRYRLGAMTGRKFQYMMLRERLMALPGKTVRAAQRRLGLRAADKGQGGSYLWALRNVSFEVEPGDVVGIIGRNGSGKSTLLKILSRVVEPTEGYAEVRGRVGSLLEVGTGFHPELTGRENVFLNGAILGLKRREIERKFDEIVAFSEIEPFIDTPVKHYSSGMYVRLAFAVAAHLEADILMMDEVLAVGDAEFQKKCLGKMSEVARDGRTVLFVSHNLAAVENLCQRGILLSQGRVAYAGTAYDTIAHYLRSENGPQRTNLRDRTDRRGSGAIKFTAIEFRDTENNPLDAAKSGQDIDIYLYYEKKPDFRPRRLNVSVQVVSALEVPLFVHYNELTGQRFDDLPPTGAFVLRIPRLPLGPQTYQLHVTARHNHTDLLDKVFRAAELMVTGGDFFGFGELPPMRKGPLLVDGAWRLETEAVEALPTE